MLFRYKVEKCVGEHMDFVFNGPGVGYRAVIQYYKPNAKLFKWRNFSTNNIYNVLHKLGHITDDIDTNNGLLNALQQYENIEEIMLKYIKKILEDKKYEKRLNNMLNDIDNIVLTKDWNTIEIKEND